MTHTLHSEKPAKSNETNGPAQTFPSADYLWRSDSKDGPHTDKKCYHIEWLCCYEEKLHNISIT